MKIFNLRRNSFLAGNFDLDNGLIRAILMDRDYTWENLKPYSREDFVKAVEIELLPINEIVAYFLSFDPDAVWYFKLEQQYLSAYLRCTLLKVENNEVVSKTYASREFDFNISKSYADELYQKLNEVLIAFMDEGMLPEKIL